MHFRLFSVSTKLTAIIKILCKHAVKSIEASHVNDDNSFYFIGRDIHVHVLRSHNIFLFI